MLYFICEQKKQNTFEVVIGYGLYLYFSGLSFRGAERQLIFSNKTMFQFGTGFKNIIQKGYQQKEKKDIRVRSG